MDKTKVKEQIEKAREELKRIETDYKKAKLKFDDAEKKYRPVVKRFLNTLDDLSVRKSTVILVGVVTTIVAYFL